MKKFISIISSISLLLLASNSYAQPLHSFVGGVAFLSNTTANHVCTLGADQQIATSTVTDAELALLHPVTAMPRWYKVVYPYTSFSTAGFTKTITVYQPVDGEVIHAMVVRIATAFGGGTIATYTISSGIYSNIDLLPASNATIVTNAPIPPFYSGVTIASTIGGTPSPVTATAISTVDTLNHATAGNVIFWILKSDMLNAP